jgi:hypothetical protein
MRYWIATPLMYLLTTGTREQPIKAYQQANPSLINHEAHELIRFCGFNSEVHASDRHKTGDHFYFSPPFSHDVTDNFNNFFILLLKNPWNNGLNPNLLIPLLHFTSLM